MLAEVERAYRAKRPIVFLGWQPHLMNQRFDMRYLSGGDSVFGPDFGSAKVFTNARAGYVKDCPNVGRLLNNLAFTIDGETEMMGDILERKMSPSAAAKSWLDAHPTALRGWLAGVTTFGGGPPHLTAQASPDAREGSFQQWVEGHKIPVGVWIATAMEGLKAHSGAFDFASSVIRSAVDGLTALLCTVPPPLAILALAALAWAIKRSWPLAILVGLTFLFILNQGYWAATLETLSLVLFSTLVVMVIGVPVGIACAHHPRLAAALRPVLDLMQTLPAFVYLIPALVLFGLGVVPGLISTVIFALPAPIRTTQLGVASTPRTLREAAVAFGATPWQLLLKVELPSALPQIAAGLTQSIMLSLSMVVIAALVGAGGLGVPVVRALNTVQVGMGFEAGLAIVLLAIILDRVSRPRQAGASS
jgi:glycine betaine/proline transport system substrate-binding protein